LRRLAESADEGAAHLDTIIGVLLNVFIAVKFLSSPLGDQNESLSSCGSDLLGLGNCFRYRIVSSDNRPSWQQGFLSGVIFR
jgi:hypothetical protein